MRCRVGKTVVARSVYRWFRVLCSITSGSPLLRYNIYCISIVNTNQAQLMIVYKASNVCILLTFVSANLQLSIYYYSFRLLHLHFPKLNNICHFSDHLTNLSMSSCKFCLSPISLVFVNNLVSSANFSILPVTPSSKSLM